MGKVIIEKLSPEEIEKRGINRGPYGKKSHRVLIGHIRAMKSV